MNVMDLFRKQLNEVRAELLWCRRQEMKEAKESTEEEA